MVAERRVLWGEAADGVGESASGLRGFRDDYLRKQVLISIVYESGPIKGSTDTVRAEQSVTTRGRRSSKGAQVGPRNGEEEGWPDSVSCVRAATLATALERVVAWERSGLGAGDLQMPWRPGTAVPSGVRFLFDFVLALANYFEYTSVQVGDRHGAWVDGWRLG